jgi:hypothetical protein
MLGWTGDPCAEKEPPMNPIQRFAEYAAAFEEVFKSDNTEDAVYEITGGPPFEGRHEGRDGVLAHLKQSLDTFDRRFDSRELDLLEGPELREGGVWVSWRVTYAVDGAPDLCVEGEELAIFEGDRIQRLEDRFPDEAAPRTLAWFEQHADKLHPVDG